MSCPSRLDRSGFIMIIIGFALLMIIFLTCLIISIDTKKKIGYRQKPILLTPSVLLIVLGLIFQFVIPIPLLDDYFNTDCKCNILFTHFNFRNGCELYFYENESEYYHNLSNDTFSIDMIIDGIAVYTWHLKPLSFNISNGSMKDYTLMCAMEGYYTKIFQKGKWMNIGLRLNIDSNESFFPERTYFNDTNELTGKFIVYESKMEMKWGSKEIFYDDNPGGWSVRNEIKSHDIYFLFEVNSGPHC